MKHYCQILLIVAIGATFSSCMTKKKIYKTNQSMWHIYEQRIDSAQTCDELNAIYVDFCRTVSNPNTLLNEEEWNNLGIAIKIIDKKMYKLTYKLCGIRSARYSDWWAYDFDYYIHEDGAEDDDRPYDDYDFYEDYQFGFDYDEFDRYSGQ